MPKNRSKRARVAVGIYRDSHGFEVQVCVGGERQSRRFPRGTNVDTLRGERDAMRVSLRSARTRAGWREMAPGTLAADAPRYLQAVRAMPSFTTRRDYINKWVGELGDIYRDRLEPWQIRSAIQKWSTENQPRYGKPYKPETLRHLLKALRHLYIVLDGKEAPNPARQVPLPAVERPAPRSIPALRIAAVLRQFKPRSKTRARLAVIASTGMAHAEVKRLRPEHVRWADGFVIAMGRRKGGGAAPRAVPLTPHSRLALKAMARLDAWGTFSNSSMHSRFREACAKAGFGDLAWTPYDLRHSLATQIAQLTGDERAVQTWLGHTSMSTTARYTLGSIDARLARAADVLTRRG